MHGKLFLYSESLRILGNLLQQQDTHFRKAYVAGRAGQPSLAAKHAAAANALRARIEAAWDRARATKVEV